jgi:HPt (histidine-containing phosphotransfer) domain-containing protein
MTSAPPRTAEPALATIRAAGGDELVHAMLSAFSSFANAQWAWLETQAAANAHEAVSIAARALRMSAQQVGALEIAAACETTELAAASPPPPGSCRWQSPAAEAPARRAPPR